MRSNLPICMNIKGPVFLFTLTGIQGTFAGAHRPDIVSVRWEGWLCPDSTSPSVLSVFIYIKHQSTKYKLQINDTCTCCSKKKKTKTNQPQTNKTQTKPTNPKTQKRHIKQFPPHTYKLLQEKYLRRQVLILKKPANEKKDS